ncbi:hypothetical protein EBU24_01115 [bacterium]|nr:hypothetical protein [bacterium]
MARIILSILILLTTACTKYVYVPTPVKQKPVIVEPDTLRPVFSLPQDATDDDKINAILASYSLAELRVKYLESICSTKTE